MVRDAFPNVSFHGFGDVNYVLEKNGGARKNAFRLGQLDFFATSQLAENLSLMSETVIEAEETNNFVVEIERLALNWAPSEYFNLSLGRYHTAVGYYNNAFHHGAWFQTATGRPGFLDFEDGGGIIPAHNVGFSIKGRLPLAKLGLRYAVEVGNGRPYHDPAEEKSPVLSISDDNPHKAVNVVVTAQPEFAPGWQFGAGIYFDHLTPDGQPRTEEIILHAHAVFKSGPWEFLSEAYDLRHAPEGGRSATTRAFFAQLAHKFGALTPYARYTYLDAPDHDAVWRLIETNGHKSGSAIGVRWDFSALAAFKAQLDFERRRHFNEATTLTLQACFTF